MSALKVLREEPAIKRSKSARWRAGVLIAVHVLIGLHIAHWLLAGETLTPVEPSEAIAFSRDGILNAGLFFFGAMILLTAVFGRFFCGWACHLVALQDLCRWLLEKVGLRPAPLRSRALAWVPMLAFAYMFLWPAAYRLWVGDSFAHVEWELTTSQFWATFPGWVIGALTFFVCGFAIVYFLGAKGFCTYACPYGAIFGVAEKLSPMRIRVTDACEGCGHCTAVCTSNVRVHEEVRDHKMVVDAGCMKCLDCVSVCPNGALYYGAGPLPMLAKAASKSAAAKPGASKRGLAVGEELLLALGFAAAFSTFRGLYGAVPFLMALGVAGIFAYLCLQASRLLRRPDFAWRGLTLKRGGRVSTTGWSAIAGLVLLLGFWGESALVRASEFLGERAERPTIALRPAALDVTGTAVPLGSADRAAARRAHAHFERARRWGLLEPPGAATRLAWLALLANDNAALERHAARALARGENPAQVYSLLGRAAFERGNLGGAEMAFRRALAAGEAPGAELDAGPFLSLGVLLARADRLQEASEVFDDGLARVPGSADLLYNAGLVRALMGDGEGAIEKFERALAIRPDSREARENLAGVLASLGRFEASVEQFQVSLREAPEDLATRLLLARALLGAGRGEQARAEIALVLERSPGHAAATRLLAELDADGFRSTTEE